MSDLLRRLKDAEAEAFAEVERNAEKFRADLVRYTRQAAEDLGIDPDLFGPAEPSANQSWVGGGPNARLRKRLAALSE